MNEYQNVFTELRYEVWKVSFLNAFLNSALAFFISNIISTLIKIPYIYSLVPAGIVFLWSLFWKLRQYSLRRIEEGNPEVKEILRTANDNKHRDSLMVHALFLELMEKLETVTAGVFISARATTIKLLTIAALAFIPLLIITYTPFLMIDQPLAFAGITSMLKATDKPLAPIGSIADAGQRDVTGQKDVVGLGTDKLDITTSAGQGGVDYSQTQAATGNTFKYNDYPTDVQAEQTTAGTGGAQSQAEAELIKRNFCLRTGQCT